MQCRQRTMQRGVIAATTPIIIILVLILTTLLLDGARLYAAKKEMQSIANAAATAAAQQAKACGGDAVTEESIRSVATASATAAGFSPGSDVESLQIDIGTVVSGANNNMGFVPFVNSVAESNAVRVQYNKTHKISLLLPQGLADLHISSTAVARKEVVATLSASGSTAVIGGSDDNAGLLGALLGGILTDGSPFRLDATDIQSLAETTFSLGNFLDELGVSTLTGTVDDLVGADEILRAIAAGLEDQAFEATDAIDSLLANSELVDTNVRLSDVISLVSGTEYPEQSQVPVYDTIVALALNTLSGSVFDMTELNLNVGGLLVTELKLTVGQPPSVAVGPARVGVDGLPLTSFDTGDIVLGLVVEADLLGLVRVTVPLVVETGGGEGFLASAVCAAGTDSATLLGLDLDTRVATVSTSELRDDGGIDPSAIEANLLDIAGLSTLIPTLNVSASVNGLVIGSGESDFREVSYDFVLQEPSTIESGAGLTFQNLEGAIEFDINNEVETEEEDCGFLGLGCVIGGIVSGLLDIVGGLANFTVSLIEDEILGLLGTILDQLLRPLLEALGVHLGGMTVTVHSAQQGGVVLLDCGSGACDLVVED